MIADDEGGSVVDGITVPASSDHHKLPMSHRPECLGRADMLQAHREALADRCARVFEMGEN